MAKQVEAKHGNVSVDAINISKSDAVKIAAPWYPYIVYYPKGSIE